MNIDKNEFSRRFMDGKQAVMVYLTHDQSTEAFSFIEHSATLSTGFWPTPRSQYERVIVYKRPERGRSALVWIGDRAGIIRDEATGLWHYRAKNVELFKTNEDFKTLFGRHPPQRVRYLLDRQIPSGPVSYYQREGVVDDDDVLKIPSFAATTATRLQKVRLCQQKFRAALFLRWESVCAVTGVGESLLLRASHIKPFSKSTDAERVSAHNGLLLTAGLDALFDKGFVSFDADGCLLQSKRLDACTVAAFALSPDMRLGNELTDEGGVFMRYHRENVFLE